MKFIKKLTLSILAIASISAMSARAQFDYFAQPKTYVVSPMQSVGGAVSTTNNWVDVRNLGGIVKLDVIDFSVAGSNSVTFAIQTSQDQTNVTTLGNVAIATQTTANNTNIMYGGVGLIATNTINLAGVLTTPVPATAGFSTQYIVPAQFNNTATGLSLISNSVTSFGFKVDDANRYIRIVYTGTTGSTNAVGATIIGQ
jgi:cytochrome c-type biogenesis protein CcmE